MADRKTLQQKLETILGSRNVYFQPPSSLQMNYPAIRYELTKIDTNNADNKVYRMTRKYTMTVIDKTPDSALPAKVLSAFESCAHDRHYVSDNLHHDVFTIVY